MTPAHALTAYAILCLGVLLCSLPISLGIFSLDHGRTLCVLFAFGVAIVWPVWLALVVMVLGIGAALFVLYLPVGIIAAIRGQPIVSVTKGGAQ